MDDCLTLFKVPDEVTESEVSELRCFFRARLRKKYPLPLKDDDGDVFVGLDISCRYPSCLFVKPSLLESSVYFPFLDHPFSMHFRSYVDSSIKRAVVLGAVARVDMYTQPDSLKAATLFNFANMFIVHSGFFMFAFVVRHIMFLDSKAFLALHGCLRCANTSIFAASLSLPRLSF